MKIERISIRRFGHWKEVSLPLTGHGLHVLYGPNEAGKSTLMRFLRGMLYGFKPEVSGAAARSRDWNSSSRRELDRPEAEGSLLLESAEGRWELLRSQPAEGSSPSGETPRGLLSVRRIDGDRLPVADSDGWLEQWRAGIEESLYERVYAVGLQELQELGTLHAEEVARQIYGASLGPDGRRLMLASDRLDTERRRLFGDEGLLPRLTVRERQIRDELMKLNSQRDQYDALVRERQTLEQRVSEAKRRQGEAQRQLRGLTLLEKAWEPWRQVQTLQKEMKSLRSVKSFPERGVERLREIDARIATLRKTRDRVRAEIRELRRRTGVKSDGAAAPANAPRLVAVLQQRDWLRETLSLPASAAAREKSLREQLDASVAELGTGWSVERIEGLKLSSDQPARLLTTARTLERATRRRNRLRHLLKQASRQCRLQAAEVNERLKALNALPLERSLADARTRHTDLEEAVRLQDSLRLLEDRTTETKGHLQRLQSRLIYPEWLPLMLWFFALGGMAAAGLGFYQGFQQNGVAGLMWLLLGLTCGALAWAVKNHYEIAVQETGEPIHEHRRRLENEQVEKEQSFERLLRKSSWMKSISGDSVDRWTAALRSARERRDELEQLAARQQKVLSRRQKLSGLRQKFQQFHRDVTAARKPWDEQRAAFGLPENLSVSESLLMSQRILEARRRWLEWQAVIRPGELQRTALDSFERRIQETARQWDVKLLPGQSLAEQQAALEKQLAAQQKESQERRTHQETLRQLRRAEHQAVSELNAVRKERRALLRQGKARSKREFESRAAAFARRAELTDLVELAQSELQSVASNETELALVEEDFQSYQPSNHREKHRQTTEALAAIDRDLQQIWERLGSLKQELKTLESDRRAAELRASLAEWRTDWTGALSRCAAVETAGQALDELRHRYERTCQPATLAAASEWLQRLTRGRYRSLWSPLGRHALRVEDAQGNTLSVEQLSTGTREQLFLAIRLALVRQMRDRGIDLPMVLDDVLVNFDHDRTATALETLRDFAAGGQQILLFTCHKHVADLGTSCGANSVPLPLRGEEPTRDPAERMNERRAG